jgi:hypothetical protein
LSTYYFTAATPRERQQQQQQQQQQEHQLQMQAAGGSVGERVALKLGASPAICNRLWGEALGLIRLVSTFFFLHLFVLLLAVSCA